MPTLGKEYENKPSPEELAVKEVDSYLEKIEKQAETKSQVSPLQPAPQTTPAPAPVTDDMGKIVMQQFQATAKPKITLPLTENQVREGLHHKVIDGIRWLAEWSIYIIKKYPGRVFYRS